MKLANGDAFHFIFIVDQSGSMGISNRIGLAKDALGIFVRSLPVDCRFSIISFGNRFESLVIQG